MRKGLGSRVSGLEFKGVRVFQIRVSGPGMGV